MTNRYFLIDGVIYLCSYFVIVVGDGVCLFFSLDDLSKDEKICL